MINKISILDNDIETKKPSRSGRYRKLLISPEKLLPFATKLEVLFKALEAKKNLGKINDAEFLSYGLLALLVCRRVDAFQKQPPLTNEQLIPKNLSDHFSFSDFIALLQKLALPISAFKKNIDNKLSLLDFLHNHRFRGVPDSARKALLEWLKQKYPLKLFFYIPTVSEVFELQKQGGRCLSFFKNTQALTQLHHERDAISFIIHDLIHAYEFYSNPQRARQQIGFYHWLDSIKEHPELKALINASDDFCERWEYILADMNSYCGHLLKTLHAAFVSQTRVGEDGVLWKDIVKASNLNSEAQLLFLKINSMHWVEDDFYRLERVLEGLSPIP